MESFDIPPPLEQNPVPDKFRRKYFYLVLAALFIIVIGIAAAVYFLPKSKQPSSVIVKVGEENLYQKDLDYEIAQLPPEADIDQNQIIDKLVTDSVILQSGQKMNIISLDKLVFNDPGKDYPKRIEAVKNVSNKVKAEVTHIKGIAILLFFQNGFLGPLGYDKSKAITLQKISRIHKDIIDKRITVEQAIEQIQNDSSLEQIDASYKSNAAFIFDVEKGQDPTMVKVLNDLLWQLPENSVTDVFTDKGRNTADKNAIPDDTETYYIFAVLNKKVINENLTAFDDWLSAQKKAYEIIYY